MNDSVDILSLSFDELCDFLKAIGEQGFRAAQIFKWLHEDRAKSFEAMSNLSKTLREKLKIGCHIMNIGVEREQHSSDGTVKYLFVLEDGNCIETVAMRYHHGISVCVSSQVGCRMGCRFCASTQNGLVRNLAASEILLQVYRVAELLGERVDSVVLMGIGEPLDNFDNVTKFCDIVTDARGCNLAGRAITLSSCGIVPRIDELAEQRRQLTLSISLHAPTNNQRNKTMPINGAYNIEQLIAACKRYYDITKRRISFEYAVIDGQNNSADDANNLAHLIRGMGAHVNLIPINPVRDTGFHATRESAEEFRQKLISLGVNATVRRTLGADISAACGQLRRDAAAENERDSQ
ncbi:MAG: 23S rRNA (adenine(2503)-C(2))-methyltransferase RlmN [Oscillospiraceae bacterium]